jgi:F0F1-type ATP synthase assembly protein I
MNEADKEIKQRDKVIAENESARQTVSAIRVSTWAIAIAVVIGLVVFGWVLMR